MYSKNKVMLPLRGERQFGFWIGRKADLNSPIRHIQTSRDKRVVKEGTIHEMKCCPSDDPYPRLCSHGMHACFHPIHCFTYHGSYPLQLMELHLVAVAGSIDYGGTSYKFCGMARNHIMKVGNLLDMCQEHFGRRHDITKDIISWSHLSKKDTKEQNAFTRDVFSTIEKQEPGQLEHLIEWVKEGNARDIKNARFLRASYVPKF